MSLKPTIDDLAYFGGEPVFQEPLHVGRPNLGNRQGFADRLADILDRRWFTNGGRYVQELEQRIAEFVGVRYCVAMCNATIALEIAIRALGLTGEVILPSFTFIATAHALQWQGITPVFCDVDPDTHNLDPLKIEQLITPRTTGIIGVHLWGRACIIDELTEIAQRRGLKLLFDSAHAFGCSHRGRMIGSFGNAEVFSFHATKFLNSLEGGAVVTDDYELAQKIGLMRNFGFVDYDKTQVIGTNGKLNEVSAAMGLTNMESMGEFIAVNRLNYQAYSEELADIPGVRLVPYDEKEKNNYQYVVVQIDDGKTIVNRDQLMAILHAENVLVRRYFYPGCHLMEPYSSLYPRASLALPETERLAKQVLTLPNGQMISTDTVRSVCAIIRTVIENATEVETLLKAKPAA